MDTKSRIRQHHTNHPLPGNWGRSLNRYLRPRSPVGYHGGMGNPLYEPRPERWPQFSLRGLLIVVTLAALLAQWAANKYQEWQVVQRSLHLVQLMQQFNDLLDREERRDRQRQAHAQDSDRRPVPDPLAHRRFTVAGPRRQPNRGIPCVPVRVLLPSPTT